MEVDPSPSPKTPSETVPETEIYFRLLILHHLLTSPSNYSEAINLANKTVQKIQSLNRRKRTASLRHDDETQASLINRLLRSYLHYSLYDQADKLISKTNFPTSAPNSQYARYHYYQGRIKTVQLDYTAAHTNLQQAIRRAPAPKLAPGFYQAVHKLFVVVELLMGDIPERSLFRHPVLEKALRGYFDIVKGELPFPIVVLSA